MPSVSVIVPVYNAEKRLSALMGSILSQDFDDFELIAVNDGSKDGSLRILRELAQSDARVRVIDKQNGGVSSARNAGLDAATGEYLLFCDADDRLAEGALGALVRLMRQNDARLVIARYHFVIGHQKRLCGLIDKEQTMPRSEFLSHMMRQPAAFYYSALWNKLFVREIVEREHIRFDATLKWGEDFAFCARYYVHAERVYVTQQAVYAYIKSATGLTVRTMLSIPDNIRTKWRLYKEYLEMCRQTGMYRDHRVRVLRFLFYMTLVN